MKLFITRHAEDIGPEYEDENRILTRIGVKQAKKLSKTIKRFKPNYIYCSSLTRAKQTAIIIAKKCKLKVHENELLNEQQSGNTSYIGNKNKGYVKFNESFNDGETFDELNTRAVKTIELLRAKHFSKADDRIVFITHGRFMTFLISILLGFKPNGFNLAIENCSYIIIKITDTWRPQLILPISGKLFI